MLGAIESVSFEDGYLLIRGWAALLGSSHVAGFRVSSRHVNLPTVSWRYGFPSQAARVRAGIANCGFSIRVPMKEAAEAQTRDSLVSVKPLVRRRMCESLFAVLKPSLPMPRKRDWSIVGGRFLPDACSVLGALVNDAHLARGESVLDIGCGVGRMAYVLSYYLLPTSRYEGLEPVSRWVRWNRAVIGGRFRNFRFSALPLHNPVYNPKGRLRPASVRFPYPDATFDLALATSVFQHNQVPVVKHNLGEIARVLRPGGRCLITCFLLDAKPRRVRKEKGPLAFIHPLKDCWTAAPDLPEIGIAFLETDFRRWAAERGLAIHTKLNGSWHERGSGKFYQDMIILTKR